MLQDRAVPALEFHVTDLAFAGVGKRTISTPSVCITVLLAQLARYAYDEWVLRRRDDATLLLPAVGCMDVLAAVVGLSSREWPRYFHLLQVEGGDDVIYRCAVRRVIYSKRGVQVASDRTINFSLIGTLIWQDVQCEGVTLSCHSFWHGKCM